MKIKILSTLFSTAIITLFTLFGSCKHSTSKHVIDGVDLEVEQLRSPKTTKNLNDLDTLVKYVFPYDLKNVSLTCNLPEELIEISGLSYIPSLAKFAAVNDERAILFILDLENCTIDDTYDFGRNGDFEGIEFAENLIYILKSNGNLYPFNMVTKETLAAIKTPLRSNNDVEGLAYDSEKSDLIFACKGSANLRNDSKYKHSKAFYSYNIHTDVFNKIPKFVIEDDMLINTVINRASNTNISKSKLKKLKKRIKGFSPSAIAKHPIDNHFYILSSVGKSLVVCEGDGSLLDIIFLDSDIHSQPEGITFDAEGRLYISNEGRSLTAKIYRFDYR